MEVVLYTTECPQCGVLTKKLEAKGIKFTKNTDVETMLNMGIDAVPMLAVDDKLLSFTDAVAWVNAQ